MWCKLQEMTNVSVAKRANALRHTTHNTILQNVLYTKQGATFLYQLLFFYQGFMCQDQTNLVCKPLCHKNNTWIGSERSALHIVIKTFLLIIIKRQLSDDCMTEGSDFTNGDEAVCWVDEATGPLAAPNNPLKAPFNREGDTVHYYSSKKNVWYITTENVALHCKMHLGLIKSLIKHDLIRM